LIGLVFLITSKFFVEATGQRTLLIQTKGIVGIAKDNDVIIDTAFDILSLEALFMVPR
jgi:hypothetical protein